MIGLGVKIQSLGGNKKTEIMNKDLKQGSGVKSEISPADGKPLVVRSASEIELRLKNLKLDQDYCKKWYDDAYARYESDRKYWERGEADPTEYLEANRQLVELNVQIYQLEWVLGLRP